MNYDRRLKKLMCRPGGGGVVVSACHRFSSAYSGSLVGVENPFINKIEDESPL